MQSRYHELQYAHKLQYAHDLRRRHVRGGWNVSVVSTRDVLDGWLVVVLPLHRQLVLQRRWNELVQSVHPRQQHQRNGGCDGVHANGLELDCAE